MTPEHDTTTTGPQHHPAAEHLIAFMHRQHPDHMSILQESLDECAAEGDPIAAAFGSTLRNMATEQPVCDRDLFALAWMISTMQSPLPDEYYLDGILDDLDDLNERPDLDELENLGDTTEFKHP
jgi:hypothetical protein